MVAFTSGAAVDALEEEPLEGLGVLETFGAGLELAPLLLERFLELVEKLEETEREDVRLELEEPP